MKRRKFSREFKIEAVKLVRERGVSVAQAGRDLDVHEKVLRRWVKEFGSDPVQALPAHGQMKPEQQEVERLRREVAKLKAERDILKKLSSVVARLRGAKTALWYLLGWEGSGRQLIGGRIPVKKRGPWVHADLGVVTLLRRRSRLGR